MPDPSNKTEIMILSWKIVQQEAYTIRKSVFIDEQGVPEDLELDDLDASAFHALAMQNNSPIGTARLVELGDQEAQIGRMAILRSHRRQGIGRKILESLITLAISKGIERLVLHAQLTAVPFYEKLGFVAQGPSYEEAGIAHRNMMLLLTK